MTPWTGIGERKLLHFGGDVQIQRLAQSRFSCSVGKISSTKVNFRWQPSVSLFPRIFFGAPRLPLIKSRATTSTATTGCSSTRPGRRSSSRRATRATSIIATPTTSRCSRGSASTPIASRSNGPVSSLSAGEFSLAALDHYRRVLACCHEHKITPVVTFHHFTSPRWVTGDGGWEEKKTAELFARYCERAAAHLGDLIGVACTINEANLGAYQYLVGTLPLKLDPTRLPWLSDAARRIGADPNRFAPYLMCDQMKARDVMLEAHRLSCRRVEIVAWQISSRNLPRTRRPPGRARRRTASRSHQGRMPGYFLRSGARRRFYRRPDLHAQPHQRRRHAAPGTRRRDHDDGLRILARSARSELSARPAQSPKSRSSSPRTGSAPTRTIAASSTCAAR